MTSRGLNFRVRSRINSGDDGAYPIVKLGERKSTLGYITFAMRKAYIFGVM